MSDVSEIGKKFEELRVRTGEALAKLTMQVEMTEILTLKATNEYEKIVSIFEKILKKAKADASMEAKSSTAKKDGFEKIGGLELETDLSKAVETSEKRTKGLLTKMGRSVMRLEAWAKMHTGESNGGRARRGRGCEQATQDIQRYATILLLLSIGIALVGIFTRFVMNEEYVYAGSVFLVAVIILGTYHLQNLPKKPKHQKDLEDIISGALPFLSQLLSPEIDAKFAAGRILSDEEVSSKIGGFDEDVKDASQALMTRIETLKELQLNKMRSPNPNDEKISPKEAEDLGERVGKVIGELSNARGPLLVKLMQGCY
mmetsp:Transcript_1529/g.2166  ORF Transcript_1529/g.2166 Transcript_1529/m.2166 type:complete len:315 (-) Transcript_1529:236-1180(-)